MNALQIFGLFILPAALAVFGIVVGLTAKQYKKAPVEPRAMLKGDFSSGPYEIVLQTQSASPGWSAKVKPADVSPSALAGSREFSDG